MFFSRTVIYLFWCIQILNNSPFCIVKFKFEFTDIEKKKKRKCLVFDLLTWYLLIFLLQDALLWNSFKRNPLNSLSPLSIFVLFFIWLLIYGHVQSTSSHSIQSMTKDLEQTKGINQNWSGAKNFYNCFCVIFDCYLKKVISRRNTGH